MRCKHVTDHRSLMIVQSKNRTNESGAGNAHSITQLLTQSIVGTFQLIFTSLIFKNSS